MNPEIKAKWVAALRSGAYQQATGVLRDEKGGYCCLGVLCDLVEPSKWGSCGYHNGVAGLPSYGVKKLVGFPDRAGIFPIPEVVIDDIKASLDTHNDSGATFNQLADAIEAQL